MKNAERHVPLPRGRETPDMTPGRGDPLRGPRVKLEQARRHFGRLEAEVQLFLANEPFRLEETVDQERTRIWTARIARQPPVHWAADAGDVIHNLRSALDLLMWQLELAAGNTPDESTSFPAPRDPAAADKPLAPQRLAKVTKGAAETIRLLYPVGAAAAERHPLRVLHFLDIFDKHRLLNVVGMALWRRKILHLKISGVAGDSFRVGELEPVGPLEDGMGVVRLGYIYAPDDIEARQDAEVKTIIGLSSWPDEGLVPLLRRLDLFVAGALDRLAAYAS